MIHPLFEHKWHLFLLAIACLFMGVLQAVLLYPLVSVSIYYLLLDGLIFSFLLGILSIPLWLVIRFVNFTQLSTIQRWINSIALCLLTLSTWLGAGWLLLYICIPIELFSLLLPTIPLRIMSGILLYIIVVQRYIMLVEIYRIVEEEQKQDAIAEKIEQAANFTAADSIELIDRIAVKVGQKIHVIAINDIQYLQAEGDYVMIHTTEGRYLKEQTMKYFEQHLPQNKFVRVHRSCIVNVEIISRVELYEKQNYLLHLQNGQKIKASTNGYKLLKKTLSL